MKKVILGLGLVSVLFSCNNNSGKEVVSKDSTSVKVDSVKVDSLKASVDTTKK